MTLPRMMTKQKNFTQPYHMNRMYFNRDLTIITVSDMVSLDTPPKNDAAPINANAPGSIHAH